jgi:hypothetical protein
MKLRTGDFVVALMHVYDGGPAQPHTNLCASTGDVGVVLGIACGEECDHEDRECCVDEEVPGYVVAVRFPGYDWSTDAVVGLEVRPLNPYEHARAY